MNSLLLLLSFVAAVQPVCRRVDNLYRTSWKCTYLNTDSFSEIPASGQADVTVRSSKVSSLEALFNCSSQSRVLRLDVEESKVEELGGLSCYTKLVKLKLHKSNVTVVKSGAFMLNPELDEVDLSGNKIEAISELVFANRARLVNISYNCLSSIRRESFGGQLPFNLDLSHNLLEADNSSFPTHVTILDISYNKLGGISKGLFKGLRDLAKLYLNHNTISFVEKESFAGLRSLYTLDLSDNLLTKVDFHLSDSKNLLQTLFHNNRISSIAEDTFANLSVLVVDLTNNSMSVLDSATYRPQSADDPFKSSLYLGQNGISLLETARMNHQIAYYLLNLTQNGISSIPADFFRAQGHLIALDLSHNRLRHLELDVFVDLVNLQRLNLEGNQLVEFPAALLPPLLEYLDISHNMLTNPNLHELVEHTNLRALSVDGNGFTCEDLTRNLTLLKSMKVEFGYGSTKVGASIHGIACNMSEVPEVAHLAPSMGCEELAKHLEDIYEEAKWQRMQHNGPLSNALLSLAFVLSTIVAYSAYVAKGLRFT